MKRGLPHSCRRSCQVLPTARYPRTISAAPDGISAPCEPSFIFRCSGYNGFGGGWNVGWVERRQLLGFATEFYQTNREDARKGWEVSETRHETRSTQPTHCRSPKSVITRRCSLKRHHSIQRSSTIFSRSRTNALIWERSMSIVTVPPPGCASFRVAPSCVFSTLHFSPGLSLTEESR